MRSVHDQLSTADRIYRNADPRLKSFQMTCPPLRELHERIRGFERCLDENEGAREYWRSFLGFFQRYRFNVCASPLDFNSDAVLDLPRWERIQQSVAASDRMFPVLHEEKIRLLTAFQTLLDTPENPAGKFILKRVTDEDLPRATVILPESRLVEPTAHRLRRAGVPPSIRVFGPAALRTNRVFRSLVLMGMPRWYPEYAFSACRSGYLDILCFSWLIDRWTPRPAFLGTRSAVTGPVITVGGAVRSLSAVPSAGGDIRPLPTDTTQVIARLRETVGEGTFDQCEMQLFVLEGQRGVFLDTGDSSRATVLDLQEIPSRRVRRSKVEDIEPGMFVLLRTRGEGDYILPIANHLLGTRAVSCRLLQEEWKQRLRDLAGSVGLSGVCHRLAQLGALRASEINLQNWMSARNISPQETADFRAIIELAELSHRWDEFVQATRQIRRAHIRAGNEVRHQLVHKVQAVDVDEMESSGAMEFSLTDHGEVSLTALRVERCTDIRVILPVRRTGQLFDLEEGLWHE